MKRNVMILLKLYTMGILFLCPLILLTSCAKPELIVLDGEKVLMKIDCGLGGCTAYDVDQKGIIIQQPIRALDNYYCASESYWLEIYDLLKEISTEND